jgi:hypothetical protein
MARGGWRRKEGVLNNFFIEMGVSPPAIFNDQSLMIMFFKLKY